jgi:hypothetical protein
MSLSIAPAPHPVPVAPPAAASPNAAQQTQLNQLVNKYKIAASHNGGAAALASLARQITVAARELGQTIRLPTVLTATGSAPPTSSAGSAAHAEVTPPSNGGGGIGGRVNATA